MLFARGYEAKERQRIFAHMGMNQKGNFGVQFSQRRVSRKRHLHEITDAAHVHEHLVRSFFGEPSAQLDRKSTRLNSSHSQISYAVFCLKKKKITHVNIRHITSDWN